MLIYKSSLSLFIIAVAMYVNVRIYTRIHTQHRLCVCMSLVNAELWPNIDFHILYFSIVLCSHLFVFFFHCFAATRCAIVFERTSLRMVSSEDPVTNMGEIINMNGTMEQYGSRVADVVFGVEFNFWVSTGGRT